MLKVIIADDIKDIRESISKSLAKHCPNVQLVASTSSVEETTAAIKQHNPDIVLLDIEMKDGTGFDVVKNFHNPSFKIIFITAYQQYSLEAFQFSALDYILKPVDPEHLVKAINKANDVVDREKLMLKIDSFLYNMKEASKGPKKIVLKTSDTIHVVALNEIVYAEADHRYTSFYLMDSTRIVVTKTLGGYEELFANHNFLRIHQTYLINIDYIKRYNKQGGSVLLVNDITLPVAVRKKDQLLQALSSL
jgi:two-component system LytT family response regulator